MEFVACESCGCKNASNAYFCEKCGKFLFVGDFKSSGIFADAEMKLSRIAQNLKENPHIDILWNDTIDAYARKVEKIQSLIRISDIGIDSQELKTK